MMLVPCPHCGPRNASEFRSHGEVKTRPDPGMPRAAEWRAYLYERRNLAGWTTETWFHVAGCRRFLLVERHTVTNEIGAVRPPGGEGTTP
jgi:sarcosine oxidase subunit delta